jgi:hypothetical protein
MNTLKGTTLPELGTLSLKGTTLPNMGTLSLWHKSKRNHTTLPKTCTPSLNGTTLPTAWAHNVLNGPHCHRGMISPLGTMLTADLKGLHILQLGNDSLNGTTLTSALANLDTQESLIIIN